MFKCKVSCAPRRIAQKILVECENVALHIVDAAVYALSVLVQVAGNGYCGNNLFIDIGRVGRNSGCLRRLFGCLFGLLFPYSSLSDASEAEVEDDKAQETTLMAIIARIPP